MYILVLVVTPTRLHTSRAGSFKSELAKISELRNKWFKNTKNGPLINLFCFSSNFDETWWSCSTPMCTSFIKIGWKTKKI